jgi:LAS superfamily LD-carboxypeptidase LdcB
MDEQGNKSFLKSLIPAGVVFIILGGVITYGFFKVSDLAKELALTNAKLAETENRFSQSVADLDSRASGLSDTLSGAQKNIDAVKSKVGGVEEAVGSISGTVETLEKLSQTDKEFLKKYSKVYFLNENYVPAHLTEMPTDYSYSSLRTEHFLSEAWPFLKNLLDSVKADGHELYVKSAYRSFAEQQLIKSSYAITYGAGTANAFSADQGYSEHQLGTTVDFITTGFDGMLTADFDQTDEYSWLRDNAYKFGFVLSYPEGNDYYIYEPWHWRFVGAALAAHLYGNNLKFYDLDQREIDAYLANIFD